MSKKWEHLTSLDIRFIENNYDKMSVKQMAAKLDKPLNSVYRIVRKIEQAEYEFSQPRIQRPPAVYSNPQYSQLCKE